MSCEKYLPLINELIEGELDEPIAERINSHVFVCEQCSSYYKEQKQEREIYAHYLFEVEPPADLWLKLQTQINAEADTVSEVFETSVVAPFWKLNIFGFLRLSPALGIAVVLIILGIGLSKIVSDKTVSFNEYTVQKDSKDILATSQTADEIVKKTTEDLSTKNVSDNIVAHSKKLIKASNKTISLKHKPNNEITNKFVTVESLKKNDGMSLDNDRVKILTNVQPNEEQQKLLQLKNLESETAQQIEKTELLLRSFRNARLVEGSSIYDIGYEKQQARKLLEKNARLRQIAENYGNLYTQEILDKVEPFLLDIANLENNPLPEKVLDIKERVRNQNIIASLQVY